MEKELGQMSEEFYIQLINCILNLRTKFSIFRKLLKNTKCRSSRLNLAEYFYGHLMSDNFRVHCPSTFFKLFASQYIRL